MIRTMIALGFALSSPSSQMTPQAIPKDPPMIELGPSGADSWAATYRMSTPTNELVFWRDSKGERSKQWTSGEDFEIVVEGRHDVLRRKDGSPFTTAKVSVPAKFRDVAGDYAPFIPFSDKSLLIYTGQFLACADKCRPNPDWKFTAGIGSSEHAIIDGQIRSSRISWTDSHTARYLFVGDAKPIDNPSFTAVIDPAVPASVHASLGANFPKFMNYFRRHLGPPSTKPMLFVSFDEHYPDSGSKGSSLANDIFMHLYGTWPTDPDWTRRVTWYFAHEAGHDFQKVVIPPSIADWWVHEGAAEMFAALALQHASSELAAYAQTRFEPARRDCAEGLKQSSLHDALASGNTDLDYTCGLVLQEGIDRRARELNPKSDGLFAVWQDYRARVDKGAPAGSETYLAAVAALAGQDTADWARHIVNDRLNDPQAALTSGSV
jgi:hypothetical protein